MSQLTGKTVAVLVEDLYQDLEVWYPLLRLREAGARVVTVGTGRARSYKSKTGYEVLEDMPVTKVKVEQFDAIVVPGGYAPDILRRYPDMVDFVRQVNARGRLIASICHGAWLLCSADVLRGKTATCFFAIKDDVVNAGARYVDEEVVRDRNLITSRKPEDLPAFMATLIQALVEQRDEGDPTQTESHSRHRRVSRTAREA